MGEASVLETPGFVSDVVDTAGWDVAGADCFNGAAPPLAVGFTWVGAEAAGLCRPGAKTTFACGVVEPGDFNGALAVGAGFGEATGVAAAFEGRVVARAAGFDCGVVEEAGFN